MNEPNDQDRKPRRSNQEWLSQFRGELGYDEQRAAHKDLANYLYVVAYNYLGLRQGKANPYALVSFIPEDLASLAQDFTQETLEKLTGNNYALLDQFSGHGRFTCWAAQIVRRQAAQELRRSYWTRRQPVPQIQDTDGENGDRLPFLEIVPSNEGSPEQAAMQQEAADILKKCLEKLAESRRVAILGCVVYGHWANDVARKLKITDNAVYLLVYRAKRDLRQCLRRSDLSEDVLEIFQE